MNKFNIFLTTAVTVIGLMTACSSKSPRDFADEYNSLIDRLESTTDSAARNEILHQLAEIQLDARDKLKKDELKEFLKLVKPIEHDEEPADTTGNINDQNR